MPDFTYPIVFVVTVAVVAGLIAAHPSKAFLETDKNGKKRLHAGNVTWTALGVGCLAIFIAYLIKNRYIRRPVSKNLRLSNYITY